MPASYAHYKFGKQCLEVMPSELKQICLNHSDLYFIGVHGPDILFYDLSHPEVGQFGGDMHYKPAKGFFENCKQVYKQTNNKEESLAYIIGFISHFALDSSCHSYVDKKVEVEQISHNKIESEYDRHLVELDGINIKKVDRSTSLKPNKQNTKIISQFYTFDYETINRCCVNQKYLLKALNSSCKLKVNILKKIMKQLKLDSFIDLFMDYEEYKPCRNSNLRLDKYRQVALDRFSKLLKNYMDYMDDKDQLDKYFDNDFEGPDNGIKVLPYEEELQYKV